MISNEIVERALAEIKKRATNYQYFFQQLNSADWVEPLEKKGFFRSPPPLELTDRYVVYPLWPESRFLARVAAQEPEKVCVILEKLPNTDNIRVHEDILDAACQMPVHQAVRLADKELSWIRSQNRLGLLLPDKLAALISHIAKGGQPRAALRLARAILAVRPEQPDEDKSRDTSVRIPPEPRALLDDWHYEQILRVQVQDLVKLVGPETFDMLADVLEDAICHSVRSPEQAGPEDYSWIWRPAIEDHTQNTHHTVKSLLVTSIRDAGVWLIRAGGMTTEHLVGTLESRRWTVFHRLALHMLAETPSANMAIATRYLMDRERFNAIGIRHEYCRLMRRAFKELTSADQETILSWILAGPDVEKYKRGFAHATEREPDISAIEKYVTYWKVERLAPIRDTLPTVWAERYRQWTTEVGQPVYPDFPSYTTGGWVGPTSPRKAAELRAMGAAELADYLRHWQEPDDPLGPSPEGLSRELTSLVAGDPGPFAASSTEFVGTDPTYVRGLLRGFQEAVKNERPFGWHPVLELCEWVVRQGHSVEGRLVTGRDRDPDWGWTRHVIAGLLSLGFEAAEVGISREYRQMCWEILHPLTEDPDPTPDQESAARTDLDPSTLSINTTRGEAMHAVVRYAIWLRKHAVVSPADQAEPQPTFDDMPEVREVLDRHLIPDSDPAASVRSVYGQWLLVLVYHLDQAWVIENLDMLFPKDEQYRYLYDACWDAYLIFCRPSARAFRLLHSQYERAIESIGSARRYKARLADPGARLAEHLMMAYWNGSILLDLGNSLLDRFFARATEELRRHALEFVGQCLENEGPVSQEVLKRLKEFWKWRLESCLADHRLASELTGFGWWFASQQFEETWALEQLAQVLTLAQKVHPDFVVAKRLAEIAPSMPGPAVHCLRLMLEGDSEGWAIHGWDDDARRILQACLESPDATVAENAVQLIHWLGAKGHLGFRDLLGAERRHR